MNDTYLPLELLLEISSFWDMKYFVRFLSELQNKELIAYLCEESELFNDIVLDLYSDLNSKNCLLSQIANVVLFVDNYCQQPMEHTLKKSCSITVRNIDPYRLVYLIRFSESLCKIRRVSSLMFEYPSIESALKIGYWLIEQLSNSSQLSTSLESVRYRTSNCRYQFASPLEYQQPLDEQTQIPTLLTDKTLCMSNLKRWDFSYVYGYFSVDYQPVLMPRLESIQLAGQQFLRFINHDQFQYHKWIPNIRELSLLNLRAQTISPAILSYVIPEKLNVLSLKQIEFTPKQLSDILCLFPNLSSFEYIMATDERSGTVFDCQSSFILHNLRNLTLGSRMISNSDIECLPDVFPNVESLTILDALPKVHSATFCKISRLNKLSKLDLSRCPTFDTESFCHIFSNASTLLRQLIELSLYVKSDDLSTGTLLGGRIVPMLLSLRRISFRGPIKRSRRELEKLFSRNDLYVKCVSTHVTTTNMYIAEAVDVELTELCYMNCIDKMCECQRKPCTSCSLLVPSCCQLDHQFVCTRLTRTDYLVSCPTCGESLTRDAYYEHMNEYHLESIGAPGRQGRNDTTFWRCWSLLLRLGRAKVSHLYHECQYNLVYDTTCGAFKRMGEMGNNRNDHSVNFEQIKRLHKQYQPQFDELLSNCTNIFEPFQHTREVGRTVQFLNQTVNSLAV